MNERYVTKRFSDLTAQELYSIHRLRNEVFIVEQQCIYQDADNKDLHSYHVMLYDANGLAAYSRIVPPGISFAELSIGRVVTAPYARRTGAGKKIMQEAIGQCRRLFGNVPIRIGAQLYAKEFYRKLGFIQASEVYDEDGIPHIEMLLPAT